jgi:hypothetical protein
MSPTMAGIAGLILLFVLIFTKMPVGFLMAIIGVAGFAYIVTVDAALSLMAKDLFDVFGSYNLTVIPLFILMGQIAFHSGISSRLFKVAYTFIGHWPGGMAVATLGRLHRFFRHLRFHQRHCRHHGRGHPSRNEKIPLPGQPGHRGGGSRRQPGHSDTPQRRYSLSTAS